VFQSHSDAGRCPRRRPRGLVAVARDSPRHGPAQHGAGGGARTGIGTGFGTMNRRRNQYDVAVVGGGMVGAVLAVALARADFSVALVEASRPADFDPDSPYDLRQSAIAPAPMRLLDNLGLWDYVAQQRACPFTGMKVWEQGSAAELLLEHTEVGLPQLGHIVDNGLVVASAWRKLDGVDV